MYYYTTSVLLNLIQDQNKIGKNKYSCKDVSQKQSDLNFECYKDVLDVFHKTSIRSELEGGDIDKAKNVGILKYMHTMIGLSAYYNNQYVLTDGIYTIPLEFSLLTIIFLEVWMLSKENENESSTSQTYLQ